jgi:TonB-linked SusC/RagA family outer membrane protein
MNRILTLLVTLVVLSVGSALGQVRQISGKVVSASDKQPLPGVNVFVKESTGVGITTNSDGQFLLKNLPANAKTLVFRFIGYKTQEVPITGGEVLISMVDDNQKIDEVVVTALGIKREKKALGYSVGEVKSDDLLRAKEANVISALSGKVAGVQVNTTSGQPGSSARITIRGNSSITGNNQPLFVIDGVPFDNSENTLKSTLDQGGSGSTGVDIDPNNIESMTVLKGASASALYGSSAANGVVLITTKSGKKGQKMKVSISHTTTFDHIIKQKLQNVYAQGERKEGQNPVFFDGETKKTSMSWGPEIDNTPGAKRYDRWAIFKTGVTNETSASLSGGTDKASYYLGLTNYDQEGTLEPINFKRKNVLFKGSYDITEKLTAKVSMGYTQSENFRLFEGNSPSSFMNSVLACPQTYNLYPALDEYGNQRIYRAGGRNNPYWLLDNTGNPSSRDRFNTSLEFLYKINSKINVIYRIGQDYYNSREESYTNAGAAGNSNETYNIYNVSYKNINSDLIIQYDTKIANDFGLNVLLGQNIYKEKTYSDGIYGNSYILPSLYNAQNCQTKDPWTSIYEKRKLGVYANVGLSYKNFLYYTFTGRNDWSSTLPTGKNSYFYPSNSLSFLFSELVPENSILSYGKIYASYSIVGNDASAYKTKRMYSTPSVYDPYRGQINFPFKGIGSFLESSSAFNSKLKNELIKETELGMDLRLLKNRIGINMSIYKKNSQDNIMYAPIDNATGYENAILNVGEVVNKGIELQISGSPIKTNDFEWELILNYGKNKSEVKKMAEGVNTIQLEGFIGEGPYIVLNQSYPVIFGSKFLRDESGNKVVNDVNGQWLIDQKSGPIADVSPKWQGGIRSNMTYKGFSLSAFVDVKVGGHVLNLDEHYLEYYGISYNTRNRPKDMKTVLQGPAGHLDQAGKLVITSPKNSKSTDYDFLYQQQLSYTTEEYVQGAGYVKLREVSLSYSFPKSILQKTKFIKGLNISVVGRNLWTKHDSDFTGADPEGNLAGSGNGQGIINYMMPPTKAYAFSLKFDF